MVDFPGIRKIGKKEKRKVISHSQRVPGGPQGEMRPQVSIQVRCARVGEFTGGGGGGTGAAGTGSRLYRRDGREERITGRHRRVDYRTENGGGGGGGARFYIVSIISIYVEKLL